MRFFSVTPRIVIGENSSASVMSFPRLRTSLSRHGAGKCLLLRFLLCAALGRFCLRLGRRLGGCFRWRAVAAHGPPGVRRLLLRYVAERSPVGFLGLLLGRDIRRCLDVVGIPVFGNGI